MPERQRQAPRGRGRAEDRQRAFQPCGEWLLVIDIAILTRSDPGGTERFQARVDVLAGLAEFLVGRVTQRADRKADSGKGDVGGHELLVEGNRRFGRFAVAPGGDDHQQVRDLREFRRGNLGHVFHDRLEAALFRRLHRAIRKHFGISRLGAITPPSVSGGDGSAGGRDERSRKPRGIH